MPNINNTPGNQPVNQNADRNHLREDANTPSEFQHRSVATTSNSQNRLIRATSSMYHYVNSGISYLTTQLYDRFITPAYRNYLFFLNTTTISAESFKELALNNQLDKNIHYIVEGDLFFKHASELTALSCPMTVKGNCKFNYCQNLVQLPNHLTVKGDLFIVECNNLKSLPDTLDISKDFTVYRNSSLTRLSNNLTVGKYLYVEYSQLVTLSDNLKVGKSVCLNHNDSLTHLSKNLTVGKTLYVRSSIQLTTLSDNLKVGKLYLEGNNSLTHLANNVTCGELVVSNCLQFTRLPDYLTDVSGNINIERCPRLTSLPNNINQLGFSSDGSIREVSLLRTGLSNEIIERLQTTAAEGMQFQFSMQASTDYKQFDNLNQALMFWNDIAKKDVSIPSMDHLTDSQTLNLKTYLERLTATADFKNIHSQEMLAIRVIDMLSLLDVNHSDFTQAITIIENALTSCDDRIIQALDDLELLVKQQNALNLAFSQNDPSQLIELAQQMLHLETIQTVAREHAKKLTFVDEIEIILAFQIGLQKKDIALPTSTQDMIFFNCAHVSDEDLQQAKQTILKQCDQKALDRYLKTWDPYQTFMRYQEIPDYDQLTTTQVELIEECPISGGDEEQMVLSQGQQISYKALKRCHTESGKHPLTREPIVWHEVQAIITH